MKKTLLIMTCLLSVIVTTNAQDEASLGSKIGSNIRDALEVFIPGGQIIETLITKLTGTDNPKGDKEIKLTVEQFKKEFEEANKAIVAKANQKIKPVKSFSEQAAFLSKHYKTTLESRRSYTDALIYLITNPSSPQLVTALNNGQSKAKELAKINVEAANDKFTFDNGTFLALSRTVRIANDYTGNISQVMEKDYKNNIANKNLLVGYIATILNNGFLDIELLTSKIGLDLIKEVKSIEIDDELISSIDGLNMFFNANSQKPISSAKYMSTSFLNNIISTKSNEEIKKHFQEFETKEDLQQFILQRSE